MNQLKIAVIGGTGKSGTYVTKELLQRRHKLRLLHRRPENLALSSPLIEIVKGDARDPEAIANVLEGCQAVMSTLGQPRAELAIFSTATNNILKAMHKNGIRRYIVTTGLSVDLPDDKKNEKVRMATDWMKSHYAETTFDKQNEYEILNASSVNWTLVRLPLIEQTDQAGELAVSLDDCPGDRVSAKDLARFLIDQLTSIDYVRKAPFIATR